jgi:hypothetical protein
MRTIKLPGTNAALTFPAGHMLCHARITISEGRAETYCMLNQGHSGEHSSIAPKPDQAPLEEE